MSAASPPLAALPVFLTAYDPAEMPGGSVDPLGFTAGYLALADAILPGMTAAAAQATYFPMLCAGLFIAEEHVGSRGLSAAAARKGRIDVALRFERLWALACALQGGDASNTQLAADDEDDENAAESKVVGVRGIRYVQREVERLTRGNSRETGTEFALLAHQYRYGAFGIYGGVAEALRLLDKSTFKLTPGFGEAIGGSFLELTSDRAERRELTRGSLDPAATVRVSALRSWGAKAYAGVPLAGDARKLLFEAFVHDPARERMLGLLERVASEGLDEWSDRALLERCAEHMARSGEPRLLSALQTAVAYDGFLRAFTLVFERVLWLCRTTNDAAATTSVFADSMIQDTCRALPRSAAELLAAADGLFSLADRALLTRGRGILEVAQQLAPAGEDVPAIVRSVLRRHSKIQTAKVERGRPKQAWVQERGSELVLTNSGVGEHLSEPTDPNTLRAPDWRFSAALSFLQAVGGLEQRRAA